MIVSLLVSLMILLLIRQYPEAQFDDQLQSTQSGITVIVLLNFRQFIIGYQAWMLQERPNAHIG